jgi:hypothetical protein
MRGASLLWLAMASGCASTYPFPVHTATMRNPSTGETERRAATGADGSRHELVAFSKDEACFRSTLDGIAGETAQGLQFKLMGFHDREQKLERTPAIASSKTVLEGSDRSVQLTSGDPVVHDVSVVQVCFDRPTTVVGPDTEFLVLDLPKKGAGGVWKLTR